MVTNDDPVGVAILGCGRIGRLHAQVLTSRVPGAFVASVFDPETTAARVVAEQSGATVADSMQAAIDAPGVGIVAICTPTDHHLENIKAACAAGKAVFCEKPIALDIEQVDAAVRIVQETGTFLHVGLNRRFDPSHAQVAKAVEEGVIGDVHLVRITSRDPAPPPVEYIRQSGGLFLDMTIHDFDMARFVSGSPVVEVFARAGVRVDPMIGEAGDVDTAIITMEHESGALTAIDNSRKATYGMDQRVEVHGAKGSASSDNMRVNTASISTDRGTQLEVLENFFLERYYESYVEQWRAFLTALASAKAPPIPIDEGRAALRVGLAAQESLRTGLPVRL